MAELLKEFEPEIASFTLIPSEGGRFEFKVNDRLLYSKLKTSRHVEPGELSGLLHSYLKEAS
jgi:selenoprotein W-related protein